MCDPISVISTVASLVSAGGQMMSAKKQEKRQESAAAADKAAADKAAAEQEAQLRKQKQRGPNVAAMYNSNQNAMGGGVASTNMTGPAGIDPMSLSLSKNTLIGG